MSRKKKDRKGGMVYSTDPDFEFESYEEAAEVVPPEDQLIRIRLDRRMRKGKVVTLVEDFVGSDEKKKDLARELKTHCGSGGSVTDGVILIQGDQEEKVRNYLIDRGFRVK